MCFLSLIAVIERAETLLPRVREAMSLNPKLQKADF